MKKSEIDLDLLFGKDRAQEDVNLSKYFIKTGQYDEIFNGTKELVLGRKGVGKSAVFSQLCLELPEKGIIPVPISPTGEDFVLLDRKTNDYKDMIFDDDFRYSLAWYELVLTEVAFSVISEKRRHLLTGSNKKLYKYVKKNEKIKGDFVSQFSNAVLRAFSGGKVLLGGAELDIDFSSFEQIGDVEQLDIKKALCTLISKNNFFILIDNLDEPWRNTKQMNSWLRGLILASRRLKRDFKNLKVVIFLRDDIYNQLIEGSDLFDSRSELMILTWKDKHYFKLRQLLSARIANYFNEPYPTTSDEIDNLISKIFPLTMKLRHQHRDTFTSYYIGERTFFKPREFLQFYKNALVISYSENLPIDYRAIISAEYSYSNVKLSYMQGEYAKTYINIEKCINTFANITENDWSVSYDKLISHLDKIEQEDRIVNAVTGNALTSREIAEFLFLAGFLRKIKQSYQKRSFITYVDEPSPRIYKQLLDIHPAFRTMLAKL